jgi:hypothetical protein
MSDPETTHTTVIAGRVPGDKSAKPADRSFATTVAYQGLGIQQVSIPAGTLSSGYSKELVPAGMNVVEWLVVNDSPMGGATGALVVSVNGNGPQGLAPKGSGATAGQAGGATPTVVVGYEVTSIIVGLEVDQVAAGAFTANIVVVPP